jgi:hypothetical protein
LGLGGRREIERKFLFFNPKSKIQNLKSVGFGIGREKRD